jgi:uncharacterized protein (TIGR03437 family)
MTCSALQRSRSARRTLTLVAIELFLAVAAAGQNRIATPTTPPGRIALKGSLSPRARAPYDIGPVESSLRLGYMKMMLKQTDVQRLALEKLLADQQDPASSDYHKWLTPEEYADRFGLSQSDAAKLSDWLTSQGFTVEYTARGRDWIAFSGTAAQVEAAFQVRVRRYRIGGETHFSISSEPSIPDALEPLVSVLLGMDDFHPKSLARMRPKNTAGPGPGESSLAPGDLATIYNFGRLYQAGIDGVGQKIVIVGRSAVDLTDIQNFRSGYGLGSPNIQVIQTGDDPGFTEAEGEADLDLEWAGAAARKASLIYVYSNDISDAAFQAIDQHLASVISMSFGGCEANVSSGAAAAIQTEAQKANAEGITWLASSGDSGAASCDPHGDTAHTSADHGLAANFPASIPEVTAVGGTEFDEGSGRYWTAANGTDGGSVVSWIPEKAWNDSPLGKGLLSTGGGVSEVFRKPSWQSGPGVPNDNFRDLPDISMAAAVYHDPYNIFTQGQWTWVGGTSASAPVFAGLVALLNQHLETNGLGNINPSLYRLAQSAPSIFHDVATGDNIVPCDPGTPNCVNGRLGYTAGPGYDLTTGLGSVDAYALVTGWSATSSITISSLIPNSATAGGLSFTLTINGTNFASGAVVQWNGSALPTAFISSTQLHASVAASLIAAAGVVSITVSSGGTISGAASFTINPPTPPAVSFTNQRVTTQAPPPSGCTLPSAVTFFVTTDNTVYLYFSATTTASDLLQNDWLAPDGAVVPGGSWQQQVGNFCFTGAKLPISNLAANRLGAWQARVYDNGSPLFSVTFTVSATGAATPVISSVGNAASYASGFLSPGEIVYIVGTGLGPAQLAYVTFTPSGVAGTQLAGTTVQFNAIAAPLIYSSAAAVAAIVPYEVSGATVQVTVTYQGRTSAPRPLALSASAPGLFTARASGSGQAAALNQDSTSNSAGRPALPGSIIVLFATGEGQTAPGGVDGKLAVAPFPKPVLPVSVKIGGVPATIIYAGAAPGEIAGVMQLNVVIPAGVFGAAVPVVLQVGSAQSQTATTISVAASDAPFMVTNKFTTGALVTDSTGQATCTMPTAKSSFLSTDRTAWVWFTFNGVQTGDVFSYNWIHPSGAVDPYQPSYTPSFTGSGCAWSELSIAGQQPATEPGNWQVRVFRNNALLFTLTFTIVVPVPTFTVTAKMTAGALVTDSSGNPNLCATPVSKTAFLTSDPLVWVWFTYDGVQIGDVFSYNWVHPSGVVDPDQPTSTVNFSGSGCSARSFSIAGRQPAAEPGNWQVKVSRNGAVLFTLPFTVASAGTTVSLHLVNNLIYAVNFSVNGKAIAQVSASSATDTTITVVTSLQVQFDMMQPTSGGQPLGDPVSGTFQTVTNPSGTFTFTAGPNFSNNVSYFAPLVYNHTSSDLLLGVNMGLQAENRCNCLASANTNVKFGYYRYFSNSSVRAYRSNSGYSGPYIYFGWDPSNPTGTITGVDPTSGVVQLNVNQAP